LKRREEKMAHERRQAEWLKIPLEERKRINQEALASMGLL
jgi:hypothetical protein